MVVSLGIAHADTGYYPPLASQVDTSEMPADLARPHAAEIINDRTGDSLLPNLANYQVVTRAGQTRIFVPKPWGTSTGAGDPFETSFTSKMSGAAGSITFVDDWDLDRRQVGEVHCGTNLVKSTARRWWP